MADCTVYKLSYAQQCLVYAFSYFSYLVMFPRIVFQAAPLQYENRDRVENEIIDHQMAQLRPGIADTVTSKGIKPHGDSQRCRQSLPRSPSPIAHSNQDTDLRTQTNEGSLMHSQACSQATCSYMNPHTPVCAVKTILIEKLEELTLFTHPVQTLFFFGILSLYIK